MSFPQFRIILIGISHLNALSISQIFIHFLFLLNLFYILHVCQPDWKFHNSFLPLKIIIKENAFVLWKFYFLFKKYFLLIMINGQYFDIKINVQFFKTLRCLLELKKGEDFWGLKRWLDTFCSFSILYGHIHGGQR